MNENTLITQHNNLINAKYKLTLNEKRLLVCVLSKIDPTKNINNDLIIQVHIKDIYKIFELEDTNNSFYFLNLAKGLRKKDFPIQALTGKMMTVGWFSSALVENGVLTIKIDVSIVPFLLDLQKQYTKYKLKNVVKFKNVHTFRIYELCKQFQKIGARKLEIQELKEILGIKNQYTKMPDFRKFVLEKTKEEINNFSDIEIGYQLEKQGRSYKYIEFNISKKINARIVSKTKKVKNNVKDIQHENSFDEAVMQGKIESIMELISEEITWDNAKSLYFISNGDIGKIAEKYFMSKGKNIGNIVGYLIKAIKEDYCDISATKENTYNPHANRFHNFKQRTDNYSEEELEEVARINRERAYAALKKNKKIEL